MNNRPKPENLIKLQHCGIYAALYTNSDENNRWAYTLQYEGGELDTESPLHTAEEIELHEEGLLSQPHEFSLEHCKPEAAARMMKHVMAKRAEDRIETLRERIKEAEQEIAMIESAFEAELEIPEEETNPSEPEPVVSTNPPAERPE